MKTSQKLSLADFLSAVPEEHKNFVTKISEAMLKSGYKQKVENKASGLYVTYNTPECKRVHLQFYFDKETLGMYLHPIFFNRQNGFLDGLPSCITSQMDLYRDCRHCNPNCYECKFTIDGVNYHKCNYNRISIEVNEEGKKVLSVFQ